MDNLIGQLVINYFKIKSTIQKTINHKNFGHFINLLAALTILQYSAAFWRILREYGFFAFWPILLPKLKSNFFTLAKSLPIIKAKIHQEITKFTNHQQKSLLGTEEEREKFRKFNALPKTGLTEDEIFDELSLYSHMPKHDATHGKVSGAIYNGNQRLTEIVSKAMLKFFWSNPLHPSLFPGVRKMEAEIVSMTVDMFNGDSKACGTMTSGGTESILMAVRAHKEWARAEKGITSPNMIVPITAHAAFDKAADYFGIRIIHIPLDPNTYRVNLKKVENAISSNTIMIVGSCPNYPHGVQDDIEGLSQIAINHDVGLHVDCCLGGFVVPFMGAAGYTLPPFDFRVPGVTSISVDPHKYGCSPKGCSVVLYRTHKLRHYQYFCCTDWPGGIYASPTMAGSRPGNLLAGCWASMVYIGKDGYVALTKSIVEKTLKMKESIKSHPELFVFGDPASCVVSFGGYVIDVYCVGGLLANKGWDFGWIQHPNGIHISVTSLTDADAFCEDLAEVMEQIRKEPLSPPTSAAKMYGTAASIPDRSIIDQLSRRILDILYEPF